MDDKELQRVLEFQEAYKQEFNEELAEGEAGVMLTQLVQFYLHISRPQPTDTPDTNNGATKS